MPKVDELIYPFDKVKPVRRCVLSTVPLVRNNDSDNSQYRSLAGIKHQELSAALEWLAQEFNGEFDPGSGRTLAACLTHASRAVRLLREYTSGERVSNT